MRRLRLLLWLWFFLFGFVKSSEVRLYVYTVRAQMEDEYRYELRIGYRDDFYRHTSLISFYTYNVQHTVQTAVPVYYTGGRHAPIKKITRATHTNIRHEYHHRIPLQATYHILLSTIGTTEQVRLLVHYKLEILDFCYSGTTIACSCQLESSSNSKCVHP